MRKSSRLTRLILALMGTMVLLSILSRPRVQMLHGADIVGLIACGACFGIGFAGLLGRLRLRNE
jgi:hypothetical protein